MNLDEIKSAVRILQDSILQDESKQPKRQDIADSIVKLLDLATSVLNAEMPKKIHNEKSMDGFDGYFSQGDVCGYNRAIDDCTLAHTRILLEKDELHDKAMEATRLNINAYRQELAKCKAENEKAREAFEEILSWIDGCYCLTEEEASKTGGKTCPNCIAKSFLEWR